MSSKLLRYTPAINLAISATCRSLAVKIGNYIPGTDYDKVSSFVKRVIDFLNENIHLIGEQEYVLHLETIDKPSTGQEFTASSLIELLKQEYNIIAINDDFKIVNIDMVQQVTPSDVSEYSHDNGCLAIHILNGRDISFYAKGIHIRSTNISLPSSEKATRKRFSRHGRDYKYSVIEFYQNRVRFSQHSMHWDPPGDKKNRKLCSKIGNKKTEAIFHENLCNWLEENIECANILKSVKKVSGDETDIEIRLHGGAFYIIEIKWLGDNGSTSYPESRLRDGMIQVKNYLERDPQVREIALVVFDGRPKKNWDALDGMVGAENEWKEVKKCMTEELPDRAYALVFWLENEDASKRK